MARERGNGHEIPASLRDCPESGGIGLRAGEEGRADGRRLRVPAAVRLLYELLLLHSLSNIVLVPAGEVIGEMFTVGDPSMGREGSGCPPYLNCQRCCDHGLERFRVLDFAGYGTIYPGLFTVNFNIWCSDANGCPVGPSLWASGPTEFCTAGWNYIAVTPLLDLGNCYTQLQSNLKCYPRFLITATHTGISANYPAWGFDNVSTPLGLSCAMHDNGCCPALYPRPQVSHYPAIHSGDYGVAFEHCPPQWFTDGADSVGNVYGFIELAWRVYVRNIYTCCCPDEATEPTTWGAIKAMYK
jgi:hypothetical protein